MPSALFIASRLGWQLGLGEDELDEGDGLGKMDLDCHKSFLHGHRPDPILGMDYHCPNTDLREARGFCCSEQRSEGWLLFEEDWALGERISEDLACIGC